MDVDDKLQRSLATRINMQISLSSISVIEEWMDAPLTRWLDSVPLPPELPGGTPASFRVSLASDLTRLRWAAFGAPGGFVPKMTTYLGQCGIDRADLALLNALGEGLEPELVGSWVSVADGELRTGWQFDQQRQFAELAPHLGATELSARLTAWVGEQQVTDFWRFAQAIGEPSFSEIELVMPGADATEQLAVVDRAFTDFLGTPLPEPVATAAATATTGALSLVVHIADGEFARLAVVIPEPGNDVVTNLCAATGVDYKTELRQLQGMMGAEQLHGLEYRQYRDETAPRVDVHLVPGVMSRVPNLSKN